MEKKTREIEVGEIYSESEKEKRDGKRERSRIGQRKR